MKTKNELFSVLISSIIFTILFYKQNIGVNLLIFESLILAWLLISRQLILKGKILITCISGIIITLLAVIFIYSDLAITVNFILLFMLGGILIYPASRSMINVITLAFSNIFSSIGILFLKLIRSNDNEDDVQKFFRKSVLFFIPLAIILFFIIIYSLSNPVFNNITSSVTNFITKYLDILFSNLDIFIIFTYILGLFISSFLLLRRNNSRIIDIDKNASDVLYRNKESKKRNFRVNDLRYELKVAVFLLIALNLLLLILNIIDIYWVWFNFQWNGQYLKQFVHEGTYLLILSILISIAIILFFFRKNLNFYSKNRFLRYLSYTWLIQNAILVISVTIRNFWYIHYFALAYKRIGVIAFLILTLYGLYTVAVKVRYRKSAFFLLSHNSYSIIIMLILLSVFNWDNIIAKYNFSNYKGSFVHLDYLCSLSDKSLPYLDKSLPELEYIAKYQKAYFKIDPRILYMTPEQYLKIINNRKSLFKSNWQAKSFLSWNYPEYKAYNTLFKKK